MKLSLEELIKHIKQSQQHRYLYHFTDEANFPSIDKKGLVSKQTMRNERWWPHTTGGNELSHSLDADKDIDNFVSLCLTRDHPMEYYAKKEGRLLNARYLAIEPDVLRIEGTKIAFGVANATSTELVPVE